MKENKLLKQYFDHLREGVAFEISVNNLCFNTANMSRADPNEAEKYLRMVKKIWALAMELGYKISISDLHIEKDIWIAFDPSVSSAEIRERFDSLFGDENKFVHALNYYSF